jgi:hypothetical protein
MSDEEFDEEFKEELLRIKELFRAVENIRQKIAERAWFLRKLHCEEPERCSHIVCPVDYEIQENDPVIKELRHLYQATEIWFFKTGDKVDGFYSNPRKHALMAWAMLRRN